MSDLLNTLKRAHEAAQSIPELEIELREVLADMGYTLGRLSPFLDDEAEPAQDMNDWRNWRFGDTVIDSQLDCMATRQVIRIEDPDYIGEQPVELTHSQKHYWPHIKNLTWHSRPAQENKHDQSGV